ncbi:MAG: hypothetical protein ACKVW3_16870 [Phycisphaerales bacterium]
MQISARPAVPPLPASSAMKRREKSSAGAEAKMGLERPLATRTVVSRWAGAAAQARPRHETATSR